MGYSDPEERRRYAREWRRKRRSAWFADKSCVACGSTTDLEIDHIDPGGKVDHNVWTWSAERRELELAKCQVLCTTCHLEKSRTSGDLGRNKACGEANGRSVLSEDDVREILSSGESSSELGNRFGVHYQTINRIRRGDRWSHL